MLKLNLTFAALTMGLCFAQSGGYAQTAEGEPFAAEKPEAPETAEEPEAQIEVDDPGAGGLLENNLGVGGFPHDKCAEMLDGEGAEMPPDEGPPDKGTEIPPDEGAEMPPDERC
jgi:hypothetical protein